MSMETHKHNCPTCGSETAEEIVLESSATQSKQTKADLDEIKENLSKGLSAIRQEIPKVPSNLDDVCKLFPNMCNQVNALYGERHGHTKASKETAEEIITCEDCEPKAKEEMMPTLAAHYGYVLKEPEKAETPEPAESKEEKVEEKPEEKEKGIIDKLKEGGSLFGED